MNVPDLLTLLIALEALKLCELALLAVIFCSIWPRVSWRHIENEDTGEIDQRRDAIGLSGDQEHEPPSRCYHRSVR